MSKPPSPPPPAPPANGNRPPAQKPAAPPKTFTVQRGRTKTAHKIVIYGPGGVGKSELCSLLPEVGIKPLFLDLDDGTGFMDVDRVLPESWDDMLAILRSDLCGEYQAIVIDDFTKAESLAIDWTIDNVPHEKGHKVKGGIEGYGFGKGYTHVYDTFLHLLAELDRHVREGRNVIGIAHECTANVPNPSGEDWIRYEPRLQSPPSGKGSIRHRVKEWCDHLLFIGFDVHVDSDGKGQGSGTRTIYPVEYPTHWAKSRELAEPIPYHRGDAELWRQLFQRKER